MRDKTNIIKKYDKNLHPSYQHEHQKTLYPNQKIFSRHSHHHLASNTRKILRISARLNLSFPPTIPSPCPLSLSLRVRQQAEPQPKERGGSAHPHLSHPSTCTVHVHPAGKQPVPPYRNPTQPNPMHSLRLPVHPQANPRKHGGGGYFLRCRALCNHCLLPPSRPITITKKKKKKNLNSNSNYNSTSLIHIPDRYINLHPTQTFGTPPANLISPGFICEQLQG
jgi:hypothetical protein